VAFYAWRQIDAIQVVMAYLMKTEQLTPEEALKAVRQHAPWVDPNPGFKHQLTLFASMGHKLDPDYEPYRAMLLAQQRQLATLNTRPLPKQSKVVCLQRLICDTDTSLYVVTAALASGCLGLVRLLMESLESHSVIISCCCSGNMSTC